VSFDQTAVMSRCEEWGVILGMNIGLTLTNPIVDFVMDNLNQNMNIRNQHVTLT
jgi:Na+/phosphate symporter